MPELVEVTTSNTDARFWDRIARKYAQDAIKDMAGYERTVARVRQCLERTDTVLEVGCGTGMTALTLAPAVARYIGTDISAEMIAIARKRAAAQGCGNVEFAVAGSNGSTWPAGSYDAVLAFNVLHLVRERAGFLRQLHAALKPGGLFISKTPCLSEMNRLIRLAVPVAQVLGKAPNVDFFTAARLIDDIAGAGFSVVEQARHGTKPDEPRIFIVARR
ncbi:MAG: class I SAM-dependent methyltransferase [Hyphomicrobiaceae bacterium]|nr:class I SAM-dependent methyltransferase [Hyphomicrobiaceae bacterium]